MREELNMRTPNFLSGFAAPISAHQAKLVVCKTKKNKEIAKPLKAPKQAALLMEDARQVSRHLMAMKKAAKRKDTQEALGRAAEVIIDLIYYGQDRDKALRLRVEERTRGSVDS